jgi:hypothetical protein
MNIGKAIAAVWLGTIILAGCVGMVHLALEIYIVRVCLALCAGCFITTLALLKVTDQI